MKFSIITVTYNSECFLRQTIESVLSQDYTDFEYIIIDGGSSDKTNDIISEYSSKISHHISEPDRNMYDAINKGMRLATGEYISILNSDDYFASSSVLSDVLRYIKVHSSEQYLGVYGNLIKVNRAGQFQRHRYGLKINYKNLLASEQLTFVGHGTVFLHHSCLSLVGFYDDTHFSYACDYDYILRCLKAGRLKHISVPIMCFRCHDNSITSSGKITAEVSLILKKHGAKKRPVAKILLWCYWATVNFPGMVSVFLERTNLSKNK